MDGNMPTLLKTMETGTDDWSEFRKGRHLIIYRDSKILRSDSVAAESIIVKLLNLNG